MIIPQQRKESLVALNEHAENKNNPHETSYQNLEGTNPSYTKAESDLKQVFTDSDINGKIPKTDKGIQFGVAPLDTNIKLPNSYLYSGANALKPNISQEITATLAVNTIYDLGTQTVLTLNLPSGEISNFIQVDFFEW